MEKIKKWRRFALALFSLLFVGILSFALVQIIPARADEEPYPECTAEYRIIEEQNDFYWDNSYWRVHSTDGSVKKMVLRIEQQGTFVIAWGTNRNYANGNAPMLYVYKYTDSAQKGEALSSVQGNGSTSQSSAMECRIEHVDVGEYVEIVFIETEHDTNSYALLWMNAPTNTVNLSASVATDSIGKGHIKSDYSIAHSGEEVDSDTYTIQWTAPFSVTAVAGEGNYFAYWTNEAGDILTRSETYTVKNVLAKNAEDHYYAHFVSSDYSATQSTQKEDKPFWNSTDGKWSLDLVNYSAEDQDVASLTYDFVAEEGQFVSFDYFQSCDAFTAINEKYHYPIFKLYLNGTEFKKFVPYNATHEETDAIGNFAVPITKTGYNQLEFRFTILRAAKSLWEYKEGDQLYVDNIKVCGEEEVQTTQFVFNFESEWLKVTCTDVAKKETKEISSGVPVDLSNGTMWQISSSAKNSKKPSEFDSSIQVNYSRTGVWTSEAGDISSYFVPQGKAIATRSTDFSSSNSSVKTFRLDGKTEIATGYKEEVPLGISATKTTDGEDTMIDIPNGTTIDFPFGKENTMVVRIDTYGHFQAENYTITLDGQAYSGRIEALDDFLAFVLTDVKNHIVSIKYNLPDEGKYIYSKTFVDFMVKEAVEGGIENIVKTPDSLNVEDTKDWGGRDTWLFDPELSEEDNYVYQASNSFLWIDESVSAGQDGLSTLAISMKDTVAEGAGSVSFEFQISGSYYAQGGQQLLGAYLCYKTGKAVEESVFWNMMEGGEQPEDLKDLAKSRTGGEIITGNGVVKAGDWYRANIMIQKGETIYVSFFSYNVKPYGDPIDTYLNIRNIRLNVGNANVKIERGTDAQGTVTSAIGEQRNENKTEAVSYNVAIGSTLELSATLGANEVFYGWSVNGALVSTEPTVSLFVEGEMNVVAWMAPANFYAARAEGRFFKTIEEAVESAESGTVYVIHDTTITKSFTIPSGVILLIPYNDANGFMEAGKPGTADNRISWLNPTYKDAYRTVTVKAGVTITVEGTLRVGAVVNYLVGQGYQGHTSGAYSELILETDSKIQVAEGGVMDVYGRVWGGSGHSGADMGTIDVAYGGKLYEPFLILDFAGGTNAFGAFMDGTTPFKRYAMINIEVPMTVHYGGMLYGHASLWVETMTLHASLDQPFISYNMGEGKGGDGQGADTFVMLHKGASVKLTYNPNKIVGNASAENGTEGIGETTMIFEGGATFSYMKFSAMGFSIPTSLVMFSIPYNYNVEFNKGEKSGEEIDATYNQYETITDFMIMPGATVKVGEGATLTLNANTWVFEGFAGGAQAGKQYPLKDDLEKGGYSASGNLIVNGTLKLGRKSPIKASVTISLEPEDESVPVAFIGIVQTEGGGRIEIPADTVLSGKVWVGIQNADYFAYTTTARVWDKAHTCFGDLVAGHTYTATSGEGFTLTELKYTNAEGGDENQTLELSSDMVGSWMIKHDNHVEPEWVYDAAKDGTADANGHKTLTRYCTELGCTHEFQKELLYKPESIGEVTYKGVTFTNDELADLFKKYYSAFPERVSVTADGDTDFNVGEHQATIEIEGGFFLVDGAFTSRIEGVKWNIVAFDLTGEGHASVTLRSESVEYNGTEQEVEVLNVMANLEKAGGTNKSITAITDYTVSYDGQDTTNAGTVTVKISGTGNYKGEITHTYQITAKKVNLTLTKQTATYGGGNVMPKIDSTQYTTNDILGGDKGNVQITIDFATKEGVTWNVGKYNLTATLTNTNGHENYVIGTVSDAENAFEITRKDATVTVQKQNKPYNGKEQSYDADDWTADGLVNGEGKEVLGVQLSATGKEANSYDVTASYTGANYTVTFKGADELQTADNTIKAAFVIDPQDASQAEVQVNKTYTYNGEEQTADVTVTLDEFDGALVLNKDYTIEYGAANRTNAGTVEFTVQFTGNFSGTKEGSFEIQKATLTIVPDAKNSPKGQKHVELTATPQGLIEKDRGAFDAAKDTIYTLFVNVNEQSETGTYDITVEISLSEWTDYKVKAGDGKDKYTVTPEVFANVKFKEFGTVTYDGETHKVELELGAPGAGTEGDFGKPAISYWKGSVKGGDEAKLSEIRDASEYYVEAVVTFTVKGGETYTTTLQTTVTIHKKNIAEATITLKDAKLVYTGKEIKPEVTEVKMGELKMQPGEYTVDWSDNTDAGSEAKVTVTANEGNFTGTASTNFTIEARDIQGAAIAVATTPQDGFVYNGEAQTPSLTVTLSADDLDAPLTLTLNKDYTATYSNNENVGKASVELKGANNFKGTVSANELFEITPKQITVTIGKQTFTYAGNVAPTLDQSKWDTNGLCTGDEKADLHVTLSLAAHEGNWNADVHREAIEGSHQNGNYTVTFVKGELEILKKSVTVTIIDKTTQYGDQYDPLTFTVEDLASGDEESALGVKLSVTGMDGSSLLGKGDYIITGAYQSDNYEVKFAGSKGTAGTYTIAPRKITVTIDSHQKIYDGTVPTVEDSAWSAEQGAIIGNDHLGITLEIVDAAEDVKEGGYKIKGASTNSNYDVEFVDGVFTIKARELTVEIHDQSETYDHEKAQKQYGKKYKFDGSAWSIVLSSGDGLADGETREMLGITLQVAGTLSNAGKYAIAGECGNTNYAVTFTGNYDEDGEYKGTAGLYTIEKLDVSEEAAFMLSVKDGSDIKTEEGGAVVRVKFAGKAIELVCETTLLMGEDSVELATKLSRESIGAEEGIGSYEITVTIDDVNYCGQAVITVIVTDANGYTQRLKDVLAQLGTLTAELDKEHLKAEDYTVLLEVVKALGSLDEEERKVGAEELAEYEEYVTAWEELADIGEVIETAKTVANAPIAALFEAAATLTALAGLAYIAFKGGML